jgi:adenylyltransferase/sulfurtransferase
MDNDVLSERERRRYEQQILIEGIGEQGQEKIKLSRILVIGAGGKGTSALKNLITAGVGYVGVSDDSLIQEDTLGRQSLYGDNDIGKQKAIVSKQYLQARNTYTGIKVHNIRLTAENLNTVLEDYHVIIDATNNNDSHYAISQAALITNKPVVYSAIRNNTGIITTLNYNNNDSLKEILSNEEYNDTNPSDDISPVVIINTLTGTYAAAEALKIVLGKNTELSDNFLVIDASNYSLKLKSR